MALWINQFLFGINGHIDRSELQWDNPETMPGVEVHSKLFTAETVDGAGFDVWSLPVARNNDIEIFVSAHVMAKVVADGKAFARHGYAYFTCHSPEDPAMVGEHKDDALQSSGYGWPGMVFSTDSDTYVSMGVEAGAGAGIVRWTGMIWWMVRKPA